MENNMENNIRFLLQRSLLLSLLNKGEISQAEYDMENFENSIIRQLVAQVRVESAEELTIILHNGYRTTAKI